LPTTKEETRVEDDFTGTDVPSFIKRDMRADHAGRGAPQELEVTRERVVSVWWLIIWRAIAGSLLIGAVLGLVVGVVGAILDTPLIGGTWVSQLISVTVGIVWMIVCVRWALQKRYAGFRIAFLQQ
jgi:hypothetical protein